MKIKAFLLQTAHKMLTTQVEKIINQNLHPLLKVNVTVFTELFLFLLIRCTSSD